MRRTEGTHDATVELTTGEGVDVVVAYRYTPGTPDVFYMRNGDPGHPGDPAEVEIRSVYRFGDKTKTDISALVTEGDFEHMLAEIADVAERALDDAYERAMEDKADAAADR